MVGVRGSSELRVAGHVTGPDTYRFRTADGVHSKRSLRAASLLAAAELRELAPDETLVVDANYGVVPALSAPVTRVTATTSSARAGRLCRRNLARNELAGRVAVTADPSRLPGAFDALVYAPKPYTPTAMGKQRLIGGLDRLTPGGDVVVACRETAGFNRYERLLAEIGAEPTRVGTRDGARVLRATRPASVETGGFVQPTTRSVTVADTVVQLVTVPGVFAAPGLDDGTRHLLERISIDGDRVLDVACGAGPIAAVAAEPGTDVVATDDDPVAVACARRTLADTDVTVRLGDCTAGLPTNAFDRVVCNPPTHAGHDLLAELFAGIRRVLAPNGRCSLVHHRSVSIDDLLTPFSRVRSGATDGTYRIRHCE